MDLKLEFYADIWLLDPPWQEKLRGFEKADARLLPKLLGLTTSSLDVSIFPTDESCISNIRKASVIVVDKFEKVFPWPLSIMFIDAICQSEDCIFCSSNAVCVDCQAKRAEEQLNKQTQKNLQYLDFSGYSPAVPKCVETIPLKVSPSTTALRRHSQFLNPKSVTTPTTQKWGHMSFGTSCLRNDSWKNYRIDQAYVLRTWDEGTLRINVIITSPCTTSEPQLDQGGSGTLLIQLLGEKQFLYRFQLPKISIVPTPIRFTPRYNIEQTLEQTLDATSTELECDIQFTRIRVSYRGVLDGIMKTSLYQSIKYSNRW